jgi:hypothetical protein
VLLFIWGVAQTTQLDNVAADGIADAPPFASPSQAFGLQAVSWSIVTLDSNLSLWCSAGSASGGGDGGRAELPANIPSMGGSLRKKTGPQVRVQGSGGCH